MKERFFFGGTSRPVMIHVSPSFTLFDATFGDCTGLNIGGDELTGASGLDLRTPEELRGLVGWLGVLYRDPPDLSDGEHVAVMQNEPGYSPQFESESISPSEDFEGYDATALSLNAFWTRWPETGLTLVIGGYADGDWIHGAAIPHAALPALCSVLNEFADEWSTRGIDLRKAQPLGHLTLEEAA